MNAVFFIETIKGWIKWLEIILPQSEGYLDILFETISKFSNTLQTLKLISNNNVTLKILHEHCGIENVMKMSYQN